MTSGNNTVGSRLTPESQFPSLNATYAGWEVSEKDLVNYVDAQRRGLEFLFSVYRKAPSGVIDSPMNKFVSVYQKNEEGDFVIVSVSGNNPNDIRLMEMTNEYYGDPDPDPMTLVMKTIEMADDSGVIRPDDSYGSFGIVETASGAAYTGFVESVGKDPMPEPTASKITTAGASSPKAASRLGKIMGVLGGSLLATSAGARTNTVGGAGILHNSIKAMFSKNKTPVDPAAKQDAKMQQISATGAEKLKQVAAKGEYDLANTKLKVGGAKSVARIKSKSGEDITMAKENSSYNKNMWKNKMGSDLMHGFSSPEKYNEQKNTFKYAFNQKSKAPVTNKAAQPVYGTTPLPDGGSISGNGPAGKIAYVTNSTTMANKAGMRPNLSTSFKTTMPPASTADTKPSGITQYSDATYTSPKMTTNFGPPKSRAGQMKPQKNKFK